MERKYIILVLYRPKKVTSIKYAQYYENNEKKYLCEHYSPPVLTKSWFYPEPVGEDFTRWHEVDFSDEYRQGDKNVLEITNKMKNLLASLPRRARREALRTIRGTLLRSETYGLDGSPLQNKPYTVSESLMCVRLGSEKLKIKSEKWKEEIN